MSYVITNNTDLLTLTKTGGNNDIIDIAVSNIASFHAIGTSMYIVMSYKSSDNDGFQGNEDATSPFGANTFKLDYRDVDDPATSSPFVDLATMLLYFRTWFNASGGSGSWVSISEKFTELTLLVSAQNLTSSYADFGASIDMRGYTHLGIKVNADHNTSQGVTLKVVEVDGSDEYDIYEDGVLQEITLWTTDSTDTKNTYEFSGGGLPDIKVKAKHSSASGTVGDLTIKITKIWKG